MKDSPQPVKRRLYDAAFRAEALRLAGESRSKQAAARALNTSPKLLYKWQKEALTPDGEPAWETAMVKVFSHHQRRYGTRRLQVALRRKGYRVGRQRLRSSGPARTAA